MSYFIGSFKAEAVVGGWKLLNVLQYRSQRLNRTIVVPRGFFSDLASVPRPLRVIVPVANAKNRRAAVVHDYLCQPKVQKRMGITQADADAVWLEALEVVGVNVIYRHLLWAGVRSYQWLKGLRNR